MKTLYRGILCLVMLLTCFGVCSVTADAKGRDTISSGIYVNHMSLEGKTIEEAEEIVNQYVGTLLTRQIVLLMTEEQFITVSPGDFGFHWSNPDILRQAVEIGNKGNIVSRYKAKKDLEFSGQDLSLIFGVDRSLVKTILSEQCAVYNRSAENATLSRENGEFIIHQGHEGVVIDEEASADLICDFFTNGSWNGEDASISLISSVDKPQGSTEELQKVQDVLGTFTTSYKTSGQSRSANVANGCRLINGTTLYPGEEFSALEKITPFSQDNGYYMAGSYLNGQVVDSLGGGICQVSTTLYNAVLLSELEVTERHNHSMIVSYVDPSADAAIAESAGKDFKFVNNTEAPIYIEGYTTEDKHITFVIYGQETRSSSHSVKYVSEVVSKTVPDTEVIYTDASAPVGSVSVQSAHIGYKANLYKVTYESGQETSREMVNSSVYKPASRSATVGVATEDPNAYNAIMAAIATNSIDYVKSVAAALKGGTEVPAAPVSEAPTEEAPVASEPVVEEVPAAPAE